MAKKQQRARIKPAAPLVGRASSMPFCAYYHEGQTCSVTTDLREVFTLEGPPMLVYLACPAHVEAVRQAAEAFLLRSQVSPQTMLFQTEDGQTGVVTVTTTHTNRDE